MAGLSSKAIKNKIKSMQSTRQITKAMELVASSKLRGAQTRALTIRAFYNTLFETMNDIAESTPHFESRYFKYDELGKDVVVVIAGDRGLAGGYNSSIFKMFDAKMPKAAHILPIGKRAYDHFEKRGNKIISEEFAEAGSLTIGDCYTAARIVADGFLGGYYKSLQVVYTRFDSLLSQTTDTFSLLPLNVKRPGDAPKQDMLYEPSSEEVFDAIVPEYLGGVLWGCLCESIASEQAARRNAMNNASKNADEMIAQLDLQYNRARQAAITQEITEIIAGSES